MDNPTIVALEAFPDQLQSLYGVFPHEFKNWIPPSWDGVPSEPLTAIEQICHVRDIEVDGYQVRFRRMLDEWRPDLPALDAEAMAQDRLYSQQDAAAVLDDFRAARAGTLSLIRTLSSAQLDRPGFFEGYGPVTLRSLVHYLSSHDQQHLSGLQWLLGKLSSRRMPNAA